MAARTANVLPDKNVETTSLSICQFNGVDGLIMEHFCVKFGGPRCISFGDTMWKNRQMNTGYLTFVTSIGMGG